MSIAVELRQRRMGLVTQARALLDECEKAGRGLTAEERERYDGLDGEIQTLSDTIARSEKLAAAEVEAARVVTQRVMTHETAHASADDPVEKRRMEFRQYIRGEISGAEMRALQAGSATAGGYLMPPEDFRSDLIKAIDNLTFVRQIANVLPPLTTSEALGAPSLDADPADPTWTSELATGSEDSTMAIGKRELKPHPLAQRIKVAEKLIRMVPSAEVLVRDRLAYKIAVVEENAFLNGSGSGQPLGVFTASDDGIGTGRDYSTGNTTTAIVADNLIGQCFNLKEGYLRESSWCFVRAAMRMIRQLKDGNGQYLWLPGLGASVQDSILSRPVFVSEYAPSTFTTGLYVGILGAWKHYWIVDSLTLTIKRLEELYAETGQIGFISRLECDGAPVLAEAFTRVKLG